MEASGIFSRESQNFFVHLPIDERAISISDSLKFVQAGPKWKRSWVASLFADGQLPQPLGAK